MAARGSLNQGEIEFLKTREALDNINYNIELFRREILTSLENLRNNLDSEQPFDLEALKEFADNRAAIVELQNETNKAIQDCKHTNERLMTQLIELKTKLSASYHIQQARKRLRERKQEGRQ